MHIIWMYRSWCFMQILVPINRLFANWNFLILKCIGPKFGTEGFGSNEPIVSFNRGPSNEHQLYRYFSLKDYWKEISYHVFPR